MTTSVRDECEGVECVHPPLPSDVIIRYNSGKMELYEPHSDEPFIRGKTVDLREVR